MDKHAAILAAMSPEQRAAHVARERAIALAQRRRERQLVTLRETVRRRTHEINAQYDLRCARARDAYLEAERVAFASG